MQVLFCLISSLWSLYDSTREDISWHLLQGRYMVLGLFVFFICSLSLRRVFFHSFPSLPLSLYYSCFSSLKLFPLLFVWLCFLLYLFFSFVSFLFGSLPLLSCLCLSALCPVAEESRLDPSNVFDKVAPQLVACHTRGLSLLGHATRSSARLLPRLQHIALAAGSQLLDQHWKVYFSEGAKNKFIQHH